MLLVSVIILNFYFLAAKLDNEIINYSVRGNQAKARRRIIHFLTVFLVIALSSKPLKLYLCCSIVVCAIAALILCVMVLYYEGHALYGGATVNQFHGTYSLPASQHHFYGFVHLFQVNLFVVVVVVVDDDDDVMLLTVCNSTSPRVPECHRVRAYTGGLCGHDELNGPLCCQVRAGQS